MPPTTAPSPTFRADMLGRNQKQELADTGQFTASTGESRDAQGQNINAPLPTAPVMDASIPVASMDGANTPVQMPEMGNALEMNPSAPAIESGNAFLDAQTKAADAETAQLQSRGSAQEQNIRQLFGILGTEGEARRGLEAEAGLPGLKDAQRQISSDIINQTNQLRQFDNSNVIANEQMRIDASKRDITKRTYGAMSAEANLQNAVKRSGIVASIYATQSAGMLLQGNITQAAELINQSLESAYEPFRREMEMTKFFLERNDKQLTAAQSKQAGLELKQIDVAQGQIDRAMSLSDAAVASGYASAEDVKQISELSSDPKQQAAFAQSIVAKGAINERILNDMQRRASINASNASASASGLSRRKSLVELAMLGDQGAVAELGFDPMAKVVEEEALLAAQEKVVADKAADKEIERLDDVMLSIDTLLGDKVGLTSSSGQFRNATLSGFIGGQIMNQQEDRGMFGRIVGTMPVLGNTVNAISARQAKEDWQASMGQLLTDEGFASLIKINERVRLTPITEVEVALSFKAASALQNAARYKGEGQDRVFSHFAMSEDKVTENLATFRLGASNAQADVAGIKEFGLEGYMRLQQLELQSR